MASNFQTSARSYGQTITTVETQELGTVRSVSIIIAGQRITLKTDQSESYLNALAVEVNALIDGLRRSSPGASLPSLMALAAIQLADRAYCAEQSYQQESIKVDRHIERLNGILKTLESGESFV